MNSAWLCPQLDVKCVMSKKCVIQGPLTALAATNIKEKHSKSMATNPLRNFPHGKELDKHHSHLPIYHSQHESLAETIVMYGDTCPALCSCKRNMSWMHNPPSPQQFRHYFPRCFACVKVSFLDSEQCNQCCKRVSSPRPSGPRQINSTYAYLSNILYILTAQSSNCNSMC